MEKKKIVSLLRTFICLFFSKSRFYYEADALPFVGLDTMDGESIHRPSSLDGNQTSTQHLSRTRWRHGKYFLLFTLRVVLRRCLWINLSEMTNGNCLSPISHPGYWVNHRWPLWQQQLVNICKFSRVSATYVGLTGRMLINPAGLPLCRERIFVHCGGAVWKKNSGEGWKKKSARDRVLN